MRILLFGKNGQVGWELQRSLAPLGQLVALDRSGADGLCGNLADLEGLARTVQAFRPDVIVNAAAYTAVDKAESEPNLAQNLNTEAPALLAREAAAVGAWLIHYSTDYVFNGVGNRAWCEDDQTAPLNVYGQTKLEGEQAIMLSGCKHLIFRTSWVYAARGNNFAKTMLRLASERDRLTVIDDQVGAPTGAELIADVTAHALRVACHVPIDVSGIYHLVASGETTWNGYARHIIGFARDKGVDLRARSETVDPVPTSAFPTPARRPLNSRMNTQKLQETFAMVLPDWQVGVERMLSETLNV